MQHLYHSCPQTVSGHGFPAACHLPSSNDWEQCLTDSAGERGGCHLSPSASLPKADCASWVALRHAFAPNGQTPTVVSPTRPRSLLAELEVVALTAEEGEEAPWAEDSLLMGNQRVRKTELLTRPLQHQPPGSVGLPLPFPPGGLAWPRVLVSHLRPGARPPSPPGLRDQRE